MSNEEVKMESSESSKAKDTQTEEENDENDAVDCTLEEDGDLAVEKSENSILPINSDDEYDTDLEAEEHHEDYDPTGKNVYISCCKSLDVTPVSYFIRHITSSFIRLRHRKLGSRGVKAMAIALVLNTSVTSLDLRDNALEGDGGLHIADMLKENCFIQELDISSNGIGNKGCQAICEMLQVNTSLLKIDLSNNKLTDKESSYIAEAMRGNDKLTWMDLNNNQFSENSGENLGLGIVSNDSLEYLNLSWNHIRRKGAIQICQGLRTNCTLKTVNLSYNGFSDDGALALGEAIKFNNTLIELDISNNRITKLGALFLSKGIESNNTLEILKIGNNPVQSQGIMSLINGSLSYCDSALITLHCQDIYLDEHVIDLMREVYKIKPEFKVVPPLRAGGTDPMKTLQRYVEEDRDRWQGLFTDYIDETTNMVSRKNFVDALSKTGLNLEDDEKSRLCQQLDPTCQGMVSYKHTRLGFQPPPKVPESTSP